MGCGKNTCDCFPGAVTLASHDLVHGQAKRLLLSLGAEPGMSEMNEQLQNAEFKLLVIGHLVRPAYG